MRLRVRGGLRLAAAAFGLAALACGGGRGAGDAGGGGAGGGGPTPNPGPEVALLVVSGHDFSGLAPTYLTGTAGAYLEAALVQAGYSVETTGYADDTGQGAVPGYADLLERMRFVRDEWIRDRLDPTRVVLVAHSHGGVWAHAAARALPDVPVALLVDLDTSSNGWSLVHAGVAALLGGAPEDAYTIPVTITCPAHPALPSEPGFDYDLEDVVPASVDAALEVRSGDVVPNPFAFEMYDQRWNARLDGSTTGLDCLDSQTDHVEVQSPAGTTMPLVRDWVLSRLAAP